MIKKTELTMTSPLVSVIIPTYKRPEKLKRTVKSVLNQTYDNIEIIIVNDDPKTDITNIIKERNKIKCINQSEKKGPAAARNRG